MPPAQPQLTAPFWAELMWAERVEVLSYLEVADLQVFGAVSRGCHFGARREVDHRMGLKLTASRFLRRGEKQASGSVLLVSYPRSGNSLLRKRFEQSSGVATGSDSRPNRTLSRTLLQCGFIGEGVVDDSVCVVKSHFPERLGYVKFPASRVVLLVRNPFDAIESYFHMGFTNTHDRTLRADAKAGLMDLYTDFVHKEAQVWRAFHAYWLERCGSVPVHIVRFEDLVDDRDGSVMAGLEAFAAPSLAGAKRVAAAEEKGKDGAGYKPRGGRVGGALAHMTDAHVASILEPNTELLKAFHYEVVDRGDGDGDSSSSSSNSSSSEVRGARFLLEAQSRGPLLQPSHEGLTPDAQVFINRGSGVRSHEGDLERFGRNMTYIRRGLTQEDQHPFDLAPQAHC